MMTKIDPLLAVALTALVALMWLFLSEVAHTAENPRYEQCQTEDQPGYCIWNGEVRYFQDDNDLRDI